MSENKNTNAQNHPKKTAKPLGTGPMSFANVDWSPFVLTAPGERSPEPRGLENRDGLGDRLRFVAFAEKQAKEAFYWAAQVFHDAPPAIKKFWLETSREEEKHMNWLIARMTELGIAVDERPVHNALWTSFYHCKTHQEFSVFMANAEERGRIAGDKFYEVLLTIDPITAALFKKIADEEREHIDAGAVAGTSTLSNKF